MKMNITFCVSSMPNQRIVSGISAATGTLRPKSATGAAAASSTRQDPARIPSGTPIIASPVRTRSATRRIVAMMLASRLPLAPQRAESCAPPPPATEESPVRSDAIPASAPRVASHHPSTSSSRPSRRPAAAPTSGAAAECAAQTSPGFRMRHSYLVASSGYTFTSTRRFFA